MNKCMHCDKPYTGSDWCENCNPGIMVNHWNIEDEGLRDFILERLGKVRNYDDSYFEYVPFNQLTIHEEKIEGMNRATWNRRDIKNKSIEDLNVVMKEIKNGMTPENLSMIKAHIRCHTEFDEYGSRRIEGILRLSGITKNPNTGNYMIIIYHKELSLGKYIESDFHKFTWRDRIEILYRITRGLRRIHDTDLVHGSLRCDNVLLEKKRQGVDVFITGFGILKNDANVQDALPYLAPEVLSGQPRDKKADVYSLGVIMTELNTGKPPFNNKPHNDDLFKEIRDKGLRPDMPEETTPNLYLNLARQCLHVDPTQRPTIQELFEKSEKWYSALHGMGGIKDGQDIRIHFEAYDNK